jgi:uncharacterized membrane protein
VPSPIQASVQLSAPLSLAYRRGTSFESFPDFLPGLDAVRVLGDARLCFQAAVGGTSHTWEARIAELVRNRRLAIESEDYLPITGVFEFHSPRRGLTEVHAEVTYELDPVRGRLLDLLLDPQRQLEEGLRRFAAAVEAEHGNGDARRVASDGAGHR